MLKSLGKETNTERIVQTSTFFLQGLIETDDMNKIKMGPSPAVSRYHKQFRFFMCNDSPNYNDHEFPNPGYLIVCSGYQLLVKKSDESESIEQEYWAPELNDYNNNEDEAVNNQILVENPENHQDYFIDKLGRKHFKRFVSGPTHLVLHAVKFGSSNSQKHANDMLSILSAQVKDGKGIAFIKVDNGPDWNLLRLVNEIFFCRLWKDSKLDILGIVSYAAKYSAYNNIEHTWSPTSRKLTSMILPSILEGEDLPPYKLI